MNLRSGRSLLLGALLVQASCGDPGHSPSFTRLERLVFQPEGSCVLFAGTFAQIDCSGSRPLLIGRFEVTRAEWSRWEASRDAEAEGSSAMDSWSDLTPSNPATGMTLAEAEAFAMDQGMRLPTAREWVRTAVGSRAQGWPWGPVAARSAANTLDLGLDRLAPVGSFQSGCTALGVHDLLGNASEWVTNRIDPPLERRARYDRDLRDALLALSVRWFLSRLDLNAEALVVEHRGWHTERRGDPRSLAIDWASEWLALGVELTLSMGEVSRSMERHAEQRTLLNTLQRGPLRRANDWATEMLEPRLEQVPSDERVWALGGSYLHHKREVFWTGLDGRTQFNSELLDPEHRSADLGFRLVVDAEDWLRADAATWEQTPPARERLVAIGELWGRAAAPLLRRMCAERDASPGLLALLEGASR